MINLLARALMMSTPLLYGSIAEVYAERTGMMVTAIEGIFLMGAWGGFVVTYLTGNLFFGVMTAMLAGVLTAALYAWITVYLKQHQVVTGVAINILVLGISAFFMRVIFGVPITPLTIDPLPHISIPILSKIPVLGVILFQQNILTYIVYLIVPLAYFVLYKTSVGLVIRSTGENPEAVDVAGLSVERIRFLVVYYLLELWAVWQDPFTLSDFWVSSPPILSVDEVGLLSPSVSWATGIQEELSSEH